MPHPGSFSTMSLVLTLLMMSIMGFGSARMDRPESLDENPGSERFVSSPFNEDEVDEMVDWHNYARSTVSPPASDMEYIQWDPYLADIAQRWADKCLWEHGRPSDVMKVLGQNLWATSQRGRVKPEAVVRSWDDERQFYNHSTNTCKQGRLCGHYTQIVWSSTNSIGCGRAFCPKLEGARKNMWIVVCQYSPTGNVMGSSPYNDGPPCSRCLSGVGQCYENLCQHAKDLRARTSQNCGSCDDHDEQCDCRQLCHNCGKVNQMTCTCSCPQGFLGTDCSKTCSDSHAYCGRSPGFPNSRYCHFHPIIPRLCPKMCGICSAPDENYACEETTTFETAQVETTSTPVNGNDEAASEGGRTAVGSNPVNDKRSSKEVAE